MKLYKVEAATIAVTDGTLSSAGADRLSATVNPAAASRLVVTGSASQTAGASQTATVTATDAYGNTDTSYAGNKNITFTGANSSPNPVTAPTFRDRNAVDQNFGSATSLTFTSGVASGLMKLYKAESAVIVASDGTISSAGADRLSVTVNPAAAATLQVTAGTPQTAGTSFSAVVTAKDAFGNTATGYTGTVHFTSTDPAPTLPGDYTFVGGDSGSHTFSVTLNTTGSSTVTATDTVTGSITGTSSAITVDAGAASTATSTISAAPGSITADGSTTSTVTVQLKDALGNNLTSSGGTVALGTTSGSLGSVTDNSNGTYNATLTSAATTGTASITGTLNSSAIASSSSVTFTPGPATSLQVTVSSPQTAGVATGVTVTAKDAHGNTATSYTGNVTFSSTDGSAVLPGNYTFVAGDNGSHTFASGVTLKTAGSQTVTATDTVTGSINGTSGSVTVNPAAAATLQVSPAGTTQTAGTAFNVTVTAKDAFNNVATGYTGTADFTSTDPAPTLPGDYTFLAGDSGTKTFSVTLNTTGSRTVTATDTVTGSITGVTPAITVDAGAASTATSTISASPGSITADGSSTSTVTVQLKDALGNNLTGSGGTVSSGRRLARSGRSPTTRTAPTRRR